MAMGAEADDVATLAVPTSCYFLDPADISASDNAKFASCGGDRAVFVWDVASGQAVRKLQGHFGKLHAVAFSNDGALLASGAFPFSSSIVFVTYLTA